MTTAFTFNRAYGDLEQVAPSLPAFTSEIAAAARAVERERTAAGAP